MGDEGVLGFRREVPGRMGRGIVWIRDTQAAKGLGKTDVVAHICRGARVKEQTEAERAVGGVGGRGVKEAAPNSLMRCSRTSD